MRRRADAVVLRGLRGEARKVKKRGGGGLCTEREEKRRNGCHAREDGWRVVGRLGVTKIKLAERQAKNRRMQFSINF